MLKILEKTANYAYDWKCEFNDVEFLEVKFRSSDWSPVHDAVTQLSLSQRISQMVNLLTLISTKFHRDSYLQLLRLNITYCIEHIAYIYTIAQC